MLAASLPPPELGLDVPEPARAPAARSRATRGKGPTGTPPKIPQTPSERRAPPAPPFRDRRGPRHRGDVCLSPQTKPLGHRLLFWGTPKQEPKVGLCWVSLFFFIFWLNLHFLAIS